MAITEWLKPVVLILRISASDDNVAWISCWAIRSEPEFGVVGTTEHKQPGW